MTTENITLTQEQFTELLKQKKSGTKWGARFWLMWLLWTVILLLFTTWIAGPIIPIIWFIAYPIAVACDKRERDENGKPIDPPEVTTGPNAVKRMSPEKAKSQDRQALGMVAIMLILFAAVVAYVSL